MQQISSAAFSDTKPHYELLDGLRGVAALLVVWYHVFEGYAFAGGTLIESINHGYLAVDFFFILSGFVIGYAYEGFHQTQGHTPSPDGCHGCSFRCDYILYPG